MSTNLQGGRVMDDLFYILVLFWLFCGEPDNYDKIKKIIDSNYQELEGKN